MSRIVWNSAVGALAIFLLSEPAPAATISYADAVHTLMGACQKEMVTSCKNVHIGSGRLEACLGSSGVSQSCSATFHQVQAEIAARLEAEAAMPEICKADANRVCHNFRQGGARILRCLIRRDNVKKVTNRCNDAIDAAGWR